MVRNNILAITLIIFSASTIAFSADYTKNVGWKTGLIQIPVNPGNDVVEYGCEVSKIKKDLNEKLTKLGWQNYEAYTNTIHFDKNVALLIAKKSFQENHIIKFKKLFTENDKLVVSYKLIPNNIVTSSSSGRSIIGVSIGLTNFKFRPGIIVLIPKQVYDKGKLVCRNIKPLAIVTPPGKGTSRGIIRGSSRGLEAAPMRYIDSGSAK